jgi:predicted MPP superfamily phosphohydrolase
MPESMVLRFRDLVAATVDSHRVLIAEHGYAWWGWWNKPDERIPRAVFANFREVIERNGQLLVFLIDSGNSKLYRGTLVEIDESQTDSLKECKEPKRTPEYYSTAQYKAWFRLTAIDEISTEEIRNWSYDEVAEYLNDPSGNRFQDKRIFDVHEMLNRKHQTIYFIKRYDPSHHQDYRLELLPPVSPANFITAPIVTNSHYILQLSDLHFGTGYHGFALTAEDATRKKLSTLVIDDLRRQYGELPPAAVIISGDLTWHGHKDEFLMVTKFVEELNSVYKLDSHRFVIVPGNHDIQWSEQDPDQFDREKPVSRASEEAEANYREFYKNVFGIAANSYLSIGRRYLLSNFVAVDIVGLNSCRLEQKPFSGYGYVSSEQIQDAAAQLKWDENRRSSSQFRMLVLHHHIIPVTSEEEIEFGRLYSLTLDAAQLSYQALELGVDLMTHGHMHQPFLGALSRASRNQETLSKRTLGVHGAGSAGVRRDLTGDIGKNAFTVYAFDDTGVTIHIRSWNEDYKGFGPDWKCRFNRAPDAGVTFGNLEP